MHDIDYLQTTRESYDAIASDYVEFFRDEFADRSFDRGMLRVFAELVRNDGGGVVADVGCGFGDVTAYLGELGLQTFGIDLSSSMISHARLRYPALRFAEGSMTSLPLQDESLGGLVSSYSLIHIPPPTRPAVLAEFVRVLAPGGTLLVAFQAGSGEPLHLNDGFGHPIALDFYRLSPDVVSDQLRDAGLEVTARLVRKPVGRESTEQACLMAHKSPKL